GRHQVLQAERRHGQGPRRLGRAERGEEQRRRAAGRRYRLALGSPRGRPAPHGRGRRGRRARRVRVLEVRSLLAAVAAVLAASVAGVAIGPVRLPPGAVALEILGALPLVEVHSGLSPQEAAIVLQLRLPRVVLGLLVGAMLALAGGCYQG